MSPLLERFKLWWSSVDRGQRPIYIVGAVFLVAMIFGSVIFAGKPQLSLLFAGLSPSDQGMVVGELNKMGINAQYDANGNVLVPGNKINEARAKLAVAKKLPQTGNMGYGLLDGLGPMTSPSVEREKLKAAMEGELSNSVSAMEGIAAARVHLTLGDDSPILNDAKQASASIYLTEENGTQINENQATAVVRLVQFAVQGLQPERISVVNNRGDVVWDGSTMGSINGSANSKLKAQEEEIVRRERDLQLKLDTAYGAGNTTVDIPRLVLNFDKTSERKIERGPSKKPITSEEVTETLADANSSATPGAGTEANLAEGAPVERPTDSSKSYAGVQKKDIYEVNETQTSTEKVTGDLTAMTVNVMVNSAKIKDIASVETYVQNYLGPLANDTENFQAAVTAIEFDTEQKKNAEAAQKAASGQAMNQQIFSLLPIAALMIIGFMVVKTLSKAAKQLVPLPEPRQQMAMAGAGGMGFEMPALPGDPNYQPVDRAQLEQMVDLPPNEFAAALGALATSAPINIDDIPDKVNIPLEQIKKMSIQKPEAVANLIKTWILEERK